MKARWTHFIDRVETVAHDWEWLFWAGLAVVFVALNSAAFAVLYTWLACETKRPRKGKPVEVTLAYDAPCLRVRGGRETRLR